MQRILRPLTTTAVLALLTFGLAAPAQAAPSGSPNPASLESVLDQLGELLDQALAGLSGTTTA